MYCSGTVIAVFGGCLDDHGDQSLRRRLYHIEDKQGVCFGSVKEVPGGSGGPPGRNGKDNVWTTFSRSLLM